MHSSRYWKSYNICCIAFIHSVLTAIAATTTVNYAMRRDLLSSFRVDDAMGFGIRNYCTDDKSARYLYAHDTSSSCTRLHTFVLCGFLFSTQKHIYSSKQYTHIHILTKTTHWNSRMADYGLRMAMIFCVHVISTYFYVYIV